MKKFFPFLIILFLCCSSSNLWAQSLYCPSAGAEFQVNGPNRTRKPSTGRIIVSCEYKYKTIKGTITAYYYDKPKKSKGCDWAAMGITELYSSRRQVYVDYKYRDNRKEEFGDEFWKSLAGEFLTAVEPLALPCDEQAVKNLLESETVHGRIKQSSASMRDAIGSPSASLKIFVMYWKYGEFEKTAKEWPDAKEIILTCVNCVNSGVPVEAVYIYSNDLGDYLETTNSIVQVTASVRFYKLSGKIRDFKVTKIGTLGEWQSYDEFYVKSKK